MPDRLDHGYAMTVHRSQGDTVDASHRFDDGGGRELAYVSMSPSPQRSTVHVVADDLDQAAGTSQDWANDRRQRWAIDTGTPTTSVAEIEHARDAEPLASRLREPASALNETPSPRHPRRRQPTSYTTPEAISSLSAEALAGDLDTGGPGDGSTPRGRAGTAVHRLTSQIETAQRRADDPGLSRSHRRTARYEIRDLVPQIDDAVEHWKAIAGPEHHASHRPDRPAQPDRQHVARR